MVVVGVRDNCGRYFTSIALYQNDDSTRVSGTSTLVLGRIYTDVAVTDGFDSVSVIDIVTLLGDANDDGVVNLVDAIRVLKSLVDENVTVYTLNSDCDKNGEVDIKDALEIFKMIVNK